MDVSSFFFAGWRSIARILLVGAPAYLILLALLHFVGKHSLAKTNAYGLVVTVALGSALASAVLTKQVTLADGVVAITLLLGLQYLLATMISRWRWAHGLFTQRPALLVRDGRLLEDALKRERVTEAEVLAALRQSGIDSIEHIGAVILEADGSFSVIRAVGPSPSALKDVKGVEP
jgi:uncharacterized membrane protein YcaP (DUF421 family)